MFRAILPNVDLFWVILLYLVFLPEAGCGSADADSCHEVKTAYMMRQIGPVELVPDRAGTDESLRVCVHPGPSCCTSKMEDSYMAAVRSETQQKMRSYSFELKYLITGHTKAYQETFESLVSFTSNLTSTLFDSAYSSLASECRPLVLQLFSDIKFHLSGDSDSSLDNTVRRFYNDLFPLVYRRLLNPGIGHTSPQSYSSPSANHDDCLRMTRQDVSPFGPHPRLLVGVSELGAPWESLVVLLQRLSATLATSSNHNSMELALLAVRNHVNDAILHAQLHGPRITATVRRGDERMVGKMDCRQGRCVKRCREGVWTPGCWSHDDEYTSHHLACSNICDISNPREVIRDFTTLSGPCCTSTSAAAIPEDQP
eukprot:superscaffoldBa00003170_g16306